MAELTQGKLEVLQVLLGRLLESDEAGFIDKKHKLTVVDVNEVLATILKFRRALNRLKPEPTHVGYQYEEGPVIERLLQDAPESSTYVDIGASFPKSCSNTWPLYTRGWRGLLIEPRPQCWPAILRQRPGDYLHPVAVSDRNGFAEFRVAGELSTLRDDWPIAEQATLTVETRKLSSILEDFKSIRDNCKFCSIDVEGHEKEVISGIDFSTFSPDLFVIEFRRHDPKKLGLSIACEWLPMLIEQGYTAIDCTQLNLLLLHNRKMDLWKAVKEQIQITPDEYVIEQTQGKACLKEYLVEQMRIRQAKNELETKAREAEERLRVAAETEALQSSRRGKR